MLGVIGIAAQLIVAVVALPLAMAFAIASGVKPEQGIYTAIIAAVMVGTVLPAVSPLATTLQAIFHFKDVATLGSTFGGCIS